MSSVGETGRRKGDFSGLSEQMAGAYRTTIKNIVQSTRDRFSEPDTLYVSQTTGFILPKQPRIDKYYTIPYANSVLHLFAIGDLVKQPSVGLFVTVHTRTIENQLMQLMSIQTPKDPNLVGEYDVELFSRYLSLDQLERLNGTIKIAVPIKQEEYIAFMGPFQDIVPVGQF